LSSTEFRALSSDTRTGIIKLLNERNHTLSELSKKTALAAPTVKQHLSVLEQAGLIQCIDEGRKWKYYSLTKKGRRILEPEAGGNVLIVLALSIIGMAAVLYLLMGTIILGAVPAETLAREKDAVIAAGEAVSEAAVPGAAEVVSAALIDILPLLLIGAIFVVLMVVSLAKLLRTK